MIDGVSGVSARTTIDGVGPVSETAATIDGSMATSSPSEMIDGVAPVGSSVSMEEARDSRAPNAARKKITP